MEALRIVLTVVLIALAGFGIYALYVLVGAIGSARRLTENLDARLVPLLDDLEITVQAVNLEIMRLDDILDDIQRVSDTVDDTTRAAQGVVHVPVAKVAEYAERVRRFLSAMRER